MVLIVHNESTTIYLAIFFVLMTNDHLNRASQGVIRHKTIIFQYAYATYLIIVCGMGLLPDT